MLCKAVQSCVKVVEVLFKVACARWCVVLVMFCKVV